MSLLIILSTLLFIHWLLSLIKNSWTFIEPDLRLRGPDQFLSIHVNYNIKTCQWQTQRLTVMIFARHFVKIVEWSKGLKEGWRHQRSGRVGTRTDGEDRQSAIDWQLDWRGQSMRKQGNGEEHDEGGGLARWWGWGLKGRGRKTERHGINRGYCLPLDAGPRDQPPLCKDASDPRFTGKQPWVQPVNCERLD